MNRVSVFFIQFLAVSSVILSAALPLEQVAIKGHVYDQNSQPVSGVRVEVVESKLETSTDKNGAFYIRGLDTGSYRLLFTHPEYMPGVLAITVTENVPKTVKMDIAKLSPKLMILKEEITVTAQAESMIDVSLPSHRTIMTDQVVAQLGTSNIAETVEKTSGVTAIGKGGYSMVPAIRGLAEHRILLLVDGVPIRSERRIGASASFVNVNDIERIEVNRGPYSVFHGSGAIGGIINLITQSPQPDTPLRGSLQLGYNTARQERAGSLNLQGSAGKYGFMFSANGKKADDYASPEGIVEWSRYSDYDVMFKLNRRNENSRFYMTFINYHGVDLGKPSPASEYKPRWYPNEKNTIFTAGYETQNISFLDNFNAAFYIFPSLLETKKENLREDYSVKKRNLAEIETDNFGVKVRSGKSIGTRHTVNFGMDFFGRRNINDQNTEWEIDSAGRITNVTEETSLSDGRRNNFGFYLDEKFQAASSLTLNTGLRYDFISTSNIMEDSRFSRNDQSFTAYIGSIFQFTPRLSLLANIGRSFRFPTVSELFYTGLTGRGTVFGNPDLDPEKSLNLDAGLRYLHPDFFGSLYLFSNTISDMIQKYEGPDEDEFFYKNLSEGRITGIEGEFNIWPFKHFESSLRFHYLEGRDTTDDSPLNYIPVARLVLGMKYAPDSFWIEPSLTFSAPKKDPGPLEIETGGYTLLNTVVGYRFTPGLTFLIIGRNLLHQTYRVSADQDGVNAPGRSLIFRAIYSF